jgi:hypothetical protein
MREGHCSLEPAWLEDPICAKVKSARKQVRKRVCGLGGRGVERVRGMLPIQPEAAGVCGIGQGMIPRGVKVRCSLNQARLEDPFRAEASEVLGPNVWQETEVPLHVLGGGETEGAGARGAPKVGRGGGEG